MPAYDFQCRNCGHKFTVHVSIKEKSKTRCPECDHQELTQLFTGINILGGGAANSGSCGGSSSNGLRFT